MRPFGPDDGAELQRLLESCADYFDLVLGRPPGPAESLALFFAGPEEGANSANKMLRGIFDAHSARLVGALDAFADYPERGVWYLGLLAIAPACRAFGLGREVFASFRLEAGAAGAHEIQLNVVQQNESALRFWIRCGFEEVKRWRQRYGERESTFIRMRLAIAQASAGS